VIGFLCDDAFVVEKIFAQMGQDAVIVATLMEPADSAIWRPRRPGTGWTQQAPPVSSETVD
jgi:hypothetical protein